jgi:hypothetical protein
MAPSPLEQQRTHNILLFKKLLDLKPGVSPFTLLLDNLDQRSDSVVKEFVRRAKVSFLISPMSVLDILLLDSASTKEYHIFSIVSMYIEGLRDS